MNDIVLAGCTPTPLASYLKALGILRLLSTRYLDARGFWHADRFVLRTSLDKDALVAFFLDDYQPTPIMAPWNGGSGFYEKDNKTALTAIRHSTSLRFEPYRACLDVADTALTGINRAGSPKGDAKNTLLTRIRSLLPDGALHWFDASVSLAGDNAQYPPLLGTGGNDGRLDFTNNFMQRLTDVIGLDDTSHPKNSPRWLATALFAETSPGLAKNAIGQFSPGQAGGPNASIGFDADAAINPWDFILMIEGALTFAATTSRRHADDPSGIMSYPFTVRTVGAGSGSLGEGDIANARGELWMPLWSHAATYREIHNLMAEGRVALGKKPARDALDFVRAVHRLAGYRGIQSFQRFGLLMRSGNAYLATPLARVEVNDETPSHWLDDLDKQHWLDSFRYFASGDNAANRFHALRKRLEDILFVLSGKEPSAAEAQALLMLLGETQTALSVSPKAREAVRFPIPRLSEAWVTAANDNTHAFHITKALAGLQGTQTEPLPLRAQIFPVERKRNAWMTPDAHESVRIHTGQKGRLTDTLQALFARRLWLAEKLGMQDKPLASPAGATLDDIAAFLRDDAMDHRIAALLPGLCLCNIPRDVEQGAGPGTVPAAFGLLKLSLTPDRSLHALGLLPETEHLPVPSNALTLLAAHQDSNAIGAAWRRLHASGLAPVFASNALPTLAGISPERAAAALLIPLRHGATGKLARQLLKTHQPATDAA